MSFESTNIKDREFKAFREVSSGIAKAVVDDEGNLLLQSIDSNLDSIQTNTEENIRLKILKAEDREQYINYADFGTINQRVTSITYNADSVGIGAGFTAVKTLTYTLTLGRYRRDSIIWTLI